MKYALFLFNLAFLVIGLALLIIGVFALIKSKDFQDVFETPDAASILVIIVGLSVSIVAFFGCCGAVQEGKCMLITYALIVVIAMILEIIAAVLLLVYMGNVSILISMSSSILELKVTFCFRFDKWIIFSEKL